MRAIAVPMILLMLSASLAGCTGGDPDGNDESSIDMDILNQMIDDNLQDFINNTSVTVVNNHYSNESNEVTNHINSTSSAATYNLRIMTGAIAGVENSGNISSGNDHVLLVRGDSYSSNSSLDGAHICVGIGSYEAQQIQNWFGHNNIYFTSVPVADDAEAHSKFISGECDAIEGTLLALEAWKMQIENDGSMNGVESWISASMGNYGDLYAIESRVDFSFEQEYGTSLGIGYFYAEISVEGNCVTDCNSSDVSTSHTFTYPHPYLHEVMFSECSIPDYGLMSSNEIMLPGLDCTLTISLHAYIEYERANYEYVWSDWAYYITWSESEVTIED